MLRKSVQSGIKCDAQEDLHEQGGDEDFYMNRFHSLIDLFSKALQSLSYHDKSDDLCLNNLHLSPIPSQRISAHLDPTTLDFNSWTVSENRVPGRNLAGGMGRMTNDE